MKLYEFVYTDKQNLTETHLLQRVREFLGKESELQGWAPDYRFHQCKDVERAAEGEKHYTFEVTGRYLDTDSLEDESDLSLSSPSTSRPIAARDADTDS